jgi:hypothetical protein
MKIDIKIMRFYPHRHWFFYFRRYTYVKGFWGRICGVWFNIREKNATEKLLKVWIEQMAIKNGIAKN